MLTSNGNILLTPAGSVAIDPGCCCGGGGHTVPGCECMPMCEDVLVTYTPSNPFVYDQCSGGLFDANLILSPTILNQGSYGIIGGYGTACDGSEAEVTGGIPIVDHVAIGGLNLFIFLQCQADSRQNPGAAGNPDYTLPGNTLGFEMQWQGVAATGGEWFIQMRGALIDWNCSGDTSTWYQTWDFTLPDAPDYAIDTPDAHLFWDFFVANISTGGKYQLNLTCTT